MAGRGGNGGICEPGQGRGARGSFYAAPLVRAGKPSTCLPICLRPPLPPGRKQIGRQVEGEDQKKPQKQTCVPLGTLDRKAAKICWETMANDPSGDTQFRAKGNDGGIDALDR